jgi:hypothetical protein
MANSFYSQFKENILNELHDMNTDDIRAVLIDSADYTFSAAHDFLSEVAAGAREEVSATLTSPTIAAGVFDTGDFVFTNADGDPCEAMLLYNHDGAGAGADAARQLVSFYDTGMTGMPVDPSGGNINVTVNASGWFAL